MQLFNDRAAATDPMYAVIRAASSPCEAGAREWIEEMWEVWAPHARPRFAAGLRSDFMAGFWGLYLAHTLIGLGFDPCPDGRGGSGLKFNHGGGAIRIDIAAPPGPWAVDAGAAMARVRDAIRRCYRARHGGRRGRVAPGAHDPYIIAVNAGRLFPPGTQTQPRIAINAALPFDDADAVFTAYDVRALGGVLYSQVDPVNRPYPPGRDFVFVHNPETARPLSPGFLGAGTEYWLERVEGGWQLVGNQPGTET